MPEAAPVSPLELRTTPEAWDLLRTEFQRSLLVETSLPSLAENIDGCVWPISGPDETPGAYIDLNHEELIAKLKAQGQSAKLLDNLADILRGTIAFDESFGDMAGIASKAEAETDPVKRNLERLDISEEFPVRLCNFTPGMQEFCVREGIVNLGQFLSFTRGASRQVFISGEFKELLNAVSYVDEAVIARYLPYRGKTPGLYLVEGLAFIARSLSVEQRAQIVKRPENLPPMALVKAQEYAAYFEEQLDGMRAAISAGTPLNRMAAPLDDLALEPATAAILGVLVRKPARAGTNPSVAAGAAKPAGTAAPAAVAAGSNASGVKAGEAATPVKAKKLSLLDRVRRIFGISH